MDGLKVTCPVVEKPPKKTKDGEKAEEAPKAETDATKAKTEERVLGAKIAIDNGTFE